MWFYAHEALAQGEKAGKESDGIGDDMMELRTGEGKEIQEKGVWWKRKSAIYVRKKKNALTLLRRRLFLPWRWSATAAMRNHTRILVDLQHLARDHGRQPFSSRHGGEELEGGRR